MLNRLLYQIYILSFCILFNIIIKYFIIIFLNKKFLYFKYYKNLLINYCNINK